MLQGHRTFFGDGTARSTDACAVHVHVNRAESFQNLVDGRSGGFVVRHVDGKGCSVVAERGGGLTGKVLVEVEQGDFAAIVDYHLRRRAPEA